MSLLSVDITKVKRLSLKDVKLPQQDLKAPVDVERPKKEIKAQEIDKPKLIALAQGIVKEYNSYTKEEIIQLLKEATNVNQERAERGFNLILQIGAIEVTLRERYYLTGSTPF